MTANGSGFTMGASIQWMAGTTTTLPATLVSFTQVQATVPAALLANPGTAQVAVSSGGTTTASLPFVITATLRVTAVSVSPNSGSGMTHTFQFHCSDAQGAADLQMVWAYFTPGFNRTRRIHAAFTTTEVPVTFTSPFAGAKQVWMYGAGSAVNSGWQLLGNWTAAGQP